MIAELKKLEEWATEAPWEKGIASAKEIYDPHSGHTICRAPVADAFPNIMWEHNAALIVALRNSAKKMIAVCEAAAELFEQQAIGNGGCYRKISNCDGPCESFVICALKPIRFALRALEVGK